ncbi:SAM-dependent methyltransferase [Spongiactinospora sp. 9N601]|uniref:SAM-dependent methyltransferase n=1 Tax=Spongiactinospora sp. 9N601 TaxID=3375149 RepID=UPI00379F8F57
MSDSERVPPAINMNQMSHARAYNFVLGGKDNYAVDRAAARKVMRAAPDLPLLGRAQRRLLLRIVRMCAEQGIDQFLDIGTGIPTEPNVHETAKEINPRARVAYVDYDPIVFVHNNALLATEPSVISLQADVRDPEGIMDNPRVRSLIDYDKPMLVLFAALFHLVTDAEDPAALVARFRKRMVPGSHVMISQFCSDGSDPKAQAELEEISVNSPSPMRFRTRAEIGRFFAGFELLGPGVADVQDWSPDEQIPATSLRIAAGVGKVV